MECSDRFRNAHFLLVRNKRAKKSEFINRAPRKYAHRRFVVIFRTRANFDSKVPHRTVWSTLWYIIQFSLWRGSMMKYCQGVKQNARADRWSRWSHQITSRERGNQFSFPRLPMSGKQSRFEHLRVYVSWDINEDINHKHFYYVIITPFAH